MKSWFCDRWVGRMLEECLASVNSWFTPTFLFVLLNIVIGTIAIASNFGTSSQTHKQQQETDNQQQQQPFLARAPSSTLERLKSINLYHFRSQDFNPFTTTIQPPPQSQQPQLIPSSEIQASETTTTQEDDHKEEEHPDLYKNPYDILKHHVSRTKSGTRPTSGDMPMSLPQKMMKSASAKSAFGHFEFEELANEGEEMNKVEKRRPSTARDSKKKVSTNLQTFGEDQEVDAKADDFINRFKQQLKLQRLDSLIRYKQILTTGANN